MTNWTPSTASFYAKQDNIQLTKAHWEIIEFLRNYAQGLGLWLVIDKMEEVFVETKLGKDYLNELFPSIYFFSEGNGESWLYSELFRGLLKASIYSGIQVDKLYIKGKEYQIDDGGWLDYTIPDAWIPEFASVVARQNNVELTAEHWDILNILRQFYIENGYIPSIRKMKPLMGDILGKEKASNQHIYSLFHLGYREIAHYLGIPRSSASSGTWKGDMNGRWSKECASMIYCRS